MIAIQSTTIDEAWAVTLSSACAAPEGRLLHAAVAVSQPGPPRQDLVARNDEVLARRKQQEVDTVANTVFPASMYLAPSFEYQPGLDAQKVQELDDAATNLYENYGGMLPTLTQLHPGNRQGTYFGRLTSWPGKTPGGYNQLEVRIRQIRAQRNAGKSTFNAADVVVEGAAEEPAGAGLQVYKSTDERTRAFPCLVHVDLSIIKGRISLMAVYRHWLLVTKAYGNLIGLMRLQYFLAQQTGCEIGELMIHATSVSAEFTDYKPKTVLELASRATSLVSLNGGAA